MDLCYTVSMKKDQDIWRVWSMTLHRWGVKEWVADFLDAAGPLTVLGAQVIYVAQPLMSLAFPERHLGALARLLEDTVQSRDFSNYLREGSPSESD